MSYPGLAPVLNVLPRGTDLAYALMSYLYLASALMSYPGSAPVLTFRAEDQIDASDVLECHHWRT